MSSKYDGMALTDGKGRTIHRMPNSERAKIFMPFDALKGLKEALRETESRIEKAEGLSRCDSPFETRPDEAADLP